MASPDLGEFLCLIPNPLCLVAKGEAAGQANLEPEVPTETVFRTGNFGVIYCTSFRLESVVTLDGPAGVTWTVEVRLVSLARGRIPVARASRTFVTPSDGQILVSWMSGPCPITERWSVTTTATPDIDPGVGRIGIVHTLLVACSPIGTNLFYGEGVSALTPP